MTFVRARQPNFLHLHLDIKLCYFHDKLKLLATSIFHCGHEDISRARWLLGIRLALVRDVYTRAMVMSTRIWI
jgi:hypothetical protein